MSPFTGEMLSIRDFCESQVEAQGVEADHPMVHASSHSYVLSEIFQLDSDTHTLQSFLPPLCLDFLFCFLSRAILNPPPLPFQIMALSQALSIPIRVAYVDASGSGDKVDFVEFSGKKDGEEEVNSLVEGGKDRAIHLLYRVSPRFLFLYIYLRT